MNFSNVFRQSFSRFWINTVGGGQRQRGQLPASLGLFDNSLLISAIFVLPTLFTLPAEAANKCSAN